MILFPAIDIYKNQVVRLKKGDFNAVKIYHDSPLDQAKAFERDGATWIHVVDLEGSSTGVISVFEYLKRVKSETSLRIQFGGGIRSLETVESLLAIGVDSVVLGSFAVKEQDSLKTLCSKHPTKITVAVDVKDGMVYYQGWQQESAYTLDVFLVQMISIGVKTVMITDIQRDGMLEGLNIDWYQMISETYHSLNIIASGGVSSLHDIKALNALNLHGAIIGVSLYEKKVDLKEAIVCLKNASFPVWM